MAEAQTSSTTPVVTRSPAFSPSPILWVVWWGCIGITSSGRERSSGRDTGLMVVKVRTNIKAEGSDFLNNIKVTGINVQ